MATASAGRGRGMWQHPPGSVMACGRERQGDVGAAPPQPCGRDAAGRGREMQAIVWQSPPPSLWWRWLAEQQEQKEHKWHENWQRRVVAAAVVACSSNRGGVQQW